jgi:hypothetical protein
MTLANDSEPNNRPGGGDAGDRARDAVRALAHPSGRITDPSEVYWLLGNLRDIAAALNQTCRQLSTWHASNAMNAVSDSGSRMAGWANAESAATHLARAADLLAGAGTALDDAHNANAAVAWIPPAPRTPRPAPSQDRAGRLGDPTPMRDTPQDSASRDPSRERLDDGRH